MNSIFKEKICQYCKNKNCSQLLIIKEYGNVVCTKCLNYKQDVKKTESEASTKMYFGKN